MLEHKGAGCVHRGWVLPGAGSKRVPRMLPGLPGEHFHISPTLTLNTNHVGGAGNVTARGALS